MSKRGFADFGALYPTPPVPKPEPAPPTLAEACEVIRGLLQVGSRGYGRCVCYTCEAARDFLKRVEGK